MARNNDIRTLHISVSLGGAPSFIIHADEDAAASPVDCKFSGDGIGPADRVLLLEILQKIVDSYGQSPAVSLCIEGVQIMPDAECN